MQKLADAVAARFVPAVIVIAIATFAAWFIFGPAETRLAFALRTSIAVLIIACPCALGLATPVAILVGTGRGAQLGILIRNGEALERAGRVTTIAFDKTGTLTEGHPTVVQIVPHDCDESTLLRAAASALHGSEHPLAQAVLRYAEERGVALTESTGFINTPGKGVTATVETHRVLAGSAAFLRENAIDLAAAPEDSPHTLVVVAIDAKYAGTLAVSDPIKPTSRAAVAQLRALGLTPVMLTGDRQPAATRIAAEAGIDEIRAGLLPTQKADAIRERQARGEVVAMAGDGINDAPALAQSDLGLAMGHGTDAALASADVTLVGGDLRAAATAIGLSRATLRIVRQNLFLAFAYNVLAIPIAAGALYPLTGWLLNPVLASATMALSSVTVVTNALRLRRFNA